MDISEFSRKGGWAKSPAKTAANRSKMRRFWRKVRRGEVPPPRRHRKFPEHILALAKRYIWWLPPEESLAAPLRVVAQVMDIGIWEDCNAIRGYFGVAAMKNAMKHASPGWFRPRSWFFWHYRLNLTPWGSEPPPMPIRSYDA